jgi:NADH-quinone oxidoreductase subunit C
MDLEEIVERTKQKYPESILRVSSFRGETTAELRADDILPICRFLHDDPQFAFEYLVDLCGMDDYPADPRFLVVYHLGSLKTKLRLRLKVRLRGESPRVSSVVPVWKTANWLEREAYDMYGITFDGHPDLRRILLTPEWKGFPLRKDYPLRG